MLALGIPEWECNCGFTGLLRSGVWLKWRVSGICAAADVGVPSIAVTAISYNVDIAVGRRRLSVFPSSLRGCYRDFCDFASTLP